MHIRAGFGSRVEELTQLQVRMLYVGRLHNGTQVCTMSTRPLEKRLAASQRVPIESVLPSLAALSHETVDIAGLGSVRALWQQMGSTICTLE